MALTGPGATYGVGVMRSATIAVDEINSKGGINGKKLEFICLDSEHQPVKVVTDKGFEPFDLFPFEEEAVGNL